MKMRNYNSYLKIHFRNWVYKKVFKRKAFIIQWKNKDIAIWINTSLEKLKISNLVKCVVLSLSAGPLSAM